MNKIASPVFGELPSLLTVKEVAELLRVTEVTVYRQLTAGKLERIKVGGRTLIRAKDLDALVAGEASDGRGHT
ncbi:helix-turn-helix domain-containing protein [Rhabdothermincola salaria]|uniref:helix-turn-helix domain-containing protein n=1 Tax=Rhabdothermincola salaria TaxID=2903142 RepID=UPI001E604574|nr:helix-turn-helix domain-containing protein [Rhabdothermincola salaria]MCD9624237.1 helix-turn-helix domain-containing protein [Rhabdothermincola salaria]